METPTITQTTQAVEPPLRKIQTEIAEDVYLHLKTESARRGIPMGDIITERFRGAQEDETRG